MKNLKQIFTPNQSVDNKTTTGIFIFYIIFVGIFWTLNATSFFPSPFELVGRAYKLFTNESLGQELLTSFVLSTTSMLIAVIFSLIISYLSTIPAFRPIAFVFSKGRFNSLAGISIIFLLLFPEGFFFKVMILSFSISLFFVTSMVSEILTIEKEKFTHARTLGFSEWKVLYEVVILAKVDKVFEVIRQTYAISWMMIASVEAYFLGEGGVGSLMMRKGKYIQNLPDVIAIQLVILFLAIFQDQIILWFKNTIANWSTLKLERK